MPGSFKEEKTQYAGKLGKRLMERIVFVLMSTF